MAVVSRLELNHPALGTAGGASLHTSVEALYQKIGDAVSSRWFQLTDFDQTETVDLQHNYDLDIENIRWDIYVFTGGLWVLTTNQSSPLRSAFSVIEKVGFEDTVLQITNNTAGNDLLVAVILQNDPLYLQAGDIEDIDITTTPPEDGQALVYNAASVKFKPGASGDASFKIQSVASDGTISIKGGYLIDDAGHEYTTYDGAGSASTDVGVDITFDLDTLVTAPVNNTTYYLYIDKTLVGNEVVLTDNSRVVKTITGSQFSALTSNPNDLPLERYIPIGFVRRAVGVWSTTIFATLAFRRHQDQSVNISPLIYEDVDHSIGTVGSAGQLATYGELVQASFPNTTTLHIYKGNETSGTSLNDTGVSVVTLAGTGTPLFNSVGFFNRENVSYLNGTNQYFSASNADFGYATASNTYSYGGWFYKDSWSATATQMIISLGGASTTAIILQLDTTGVRGLAFNTTVTPSLVGLRGWHHFAITLSGTTLKLYCDGQLSSTTTIVAGTTGSSTFIGANNGVADFASISLQDVFYHKSTVLTDSQINVLYSKRFKGQQLAGGHTLEAASFPFISLTGKASFFNLTANANDGSVNAANLTNGPGYAFTGLGLFGASGAIVATGTAELTSTGSFYDHSDFSPFSVGGWFAAADWTPTALQGLFSYGSGSNVNSDFDVYVNTNNNIVAELLDDSVVYTITSPQSFVDGSWHHIAVVYAGGTLGTYTLYIDGLAVGMTVGSGTSTAGQAIRLGGRFAANFFIGRIQEFFFSKAPLTDQDIQKLVSAVITPSVSMPEKQDQNWKINFVSEDGLTVNELSDSFLVDKDDTKSWVYFGGESPSRANIRLYDGGLGSTTVPVRKFDRKYIVNPGTTIAHSLPSMPTTIKILHNENADGKYRNIGEDAGVKADGTNIYVDLSAYTIDSTHDIRIVASIGVPAIGVNDIFITKSTTYTAKAGDKIMTDSSGGAFTITLPASPGFGDEIEFFDATDSWVPNAVTVARNGQNINGAAGDFLLNIDGASARFIFYNTAQGWRVY